MYMVSIKGRAGSFEFDASSTSLCTQEKITSPGATNSVKLCTSGEGSVCETFGFNKNEETNEVTKELHLKAGVNTLYLLSRELCTLTSELLVVPK